ncbi:2-hydroxyacyl-CoA lyase 2-like [Myiozetetes cayanensis]|uniref:2-hydroxyacyl-CoA lyase 2-like n=1 Tax=Myiozetetes cayanensis TaxID=478635 RepID=UPI002160D742|nr:2-hydroxyacyl-CoA lyase 2-like [Myiozetetes cayanensis]
MELLAGLGCACAGLVAAALLGLAWHLGLLYRLCHKADPGSPRHGGELVAEVLRAHGVRFLFALPGGHISPVLVACEKLGIRVVDTRHEATAVFAADAVSRLSGVIGVAAVTAGPGVTNAVTAVKNAQMAESPCCCWGRQPRSRRAGGLCRTSSSCPCSAPCASSRCPWGPSGTSCPPCAGPSPQPRAAPPALCSWSSPSTSSTPSTWCRRSWGGPGAPAG